MCGSTLFHIRRQPNISLIYIYLYFNEIQLRRVKYSFAVKYLLRKCEKGEFHFTFGVSRIFHLYIFIFQRNLLAWSEV